MEKNNKAILVFCILLLAIAVEAGGNEQNQPAPLVVTIKRITTAGYRPLFSGYLNYHCEYSIDNNTPDDIDIMLDMDCRDNEGDFTHFTIDPRQTIKLRITIFAYKQKMLVICYWGQDSPVGAVYAKNASKLIEFFEIRPTAGFMYEVKDAHTYYTDDPYKFRLISLKDEKELFGRIDMEIAKTGDLDRHLIIPVRYLSETEEVAENVEDKAPLSQAAQKSKLNIELVEAANDYDLNKVKELIKKGAEVNTKEKYGIAALHCAAYGGHKKMVEYLIEKGADIHIDGEYKRASLHYAVMGNNKAIVEYLLNLGIDLNKKDELDSTALHLAVLCGHKEVVKYLIAKGADLHITDGPKGTLLHAAVHFGDKELVEYFIDVIGLDVNAKTQLGYTVLHIAVQSRRDQVELVKYLVSKGVDVKAKDAHSGITALQWAEREPFANDLIIKYLKSIIKEHE